MEYGVLEVSKKIENKEQRRESVSQGSEMRPGEIKRPMSPISLSQPTLVNASGIVEILDTNVLITLLHCHSMHLNRPVGPIYIVTDVYTCIVKVGYHNPNAHSTLYNRPIITL
eukprot:485335-Amorphochlora_amoeboformis.AAC.1